MKKQDYALVWIFSIDEASQLIKDEGPDLIFLDRTLCVIAKASFQELRKAVPEAQLIIL